MGYGATANRAPRLDVLPDKPSYGRRPTPPLYPQPKLLPPPPPAPGVYRTPSPGTESRLLNVHDWSSSIACREHLILSPARSVEHVGSYGKL